MVVKIPKATIIRMFKEFHPDYNITEDAKNMMVNVVSEFVRVTFNDAVKLADHRKAKTVDEKDLLLAT